MIQNPDKPDDPTTKIIEPLSKMTGSNKQRYLSDIIMMNYLLQGIPNDIYNSVDACKTTKQMWERIRSLMHESEKTKQQRHSRLVDEFDKFVAVEGEYLSSVYERLTTLMNNANIKETKFDHLFDTISQYEPHVIASRAKKAAGNHDPLALVAHSNVHSSHSHASPSYSHSPQPYYVTHPLLVIDHEEDYQGEIQGDAQEDKLTTTMMLLERVITQRYSTPTNNRLCTSSNTKNQAVIHDGRVDIKSKNAGYAGNGNENAGRSNRNQIATAGNRMDAKYFREQMLLAMKDEAGGNLNDEENDFMLHYYKKAIETGQNIL
ncbi:hypothetical protein Tco_0674947 [Tanacetum coccineum]